MPSLRLLSVLATTTTLLACDPPATRQAPLTSFCGEHPDARACGGEAALPSTVTALEWDGLSVQVVERLENWDTWMALRRAEYAAASQEELPPPELESLPEVEAPGPAHHISLSDAPDPSEGGGGGGGLGDGCDGDRVPAGQPGYCKLVFGSDDRVRFLGGENAPWDKFVKVVIDRHTNGNDTPKIGYAVCSGVFVSEDYVLTAGHCVYSHAEGCFRGGLASGKIGCRPSSIPWLSTPYGTDKSLGYVCLAGYQNSGGDFEDHCEFITRTIVNGRYTSSDQAKHDFALVQLQRANHAQGLGEGRVMRMSSIDSADVLASKTAVSHGYPIVKPNGNFNNTTVRFWVGSKLWELAGAQQYSTYGSVESETTSKKIAAKLETSEGQSGSPIFYISGDATAYTGQSAWIIGLATSNLNLTYGPTVKRFRDFVLDHIP
ncbi:MAG: trypsin-like serine protease [Myxococcota bacterium]